MFTIKADNRILTQDAQFSYLYTNYASGVSSIVVTNATSFVDNCYILFEAIGNEAAEIVKVSTVTQATNTLTLDTTTKFSHAESSRITIIPYNRVKFYHTATSTFAATELIGYVNVNPAEIYSIGTDSTNSTGYGWFVFYNSTGATTSDESNPVPYTGFSEDSVSILVERIYGVLSDSQRKVITQDEALGWINEGYSKVTDELNLVTREITVSDEISISVTSGTSEYALATRFSDLVYVRTYDASNTSNTTELEEIALRDIPDYIRSGSGLTMKYYLRMDAGITYLGLVPIPWESTTLKYRYRMKADVLDSFSDILGLPNSAFYAVRDFCLSKAYAKVADPRYNISKQEYLEGIKGMKETSVKRTSTLDAWDISDEAWV